MSYTAISMTALLHRFGYVYKQPKLIPGKADAEAKKGFLAVYEKLKQARTTRNQLDLMDAVHR